MRRPLASAGLFFIIVLFLIQLLPQSNPSKPAQSLYAPNSYITLSGQVKRIEYKKKDDAIQTIIFIKAPSVSSNLQFMCYLSSDNKTPTLGSTITLAGSYKPFESATNPGMFDSYNYYSTLGIESQIKDCSIIDTIDINSLPSYQYRYWLLRNRLEKIKRLIATLCDLCFTESDSSVIKTMLLGDKSSLSSDTRALYSQNGIAHILAISGLHISMLGIGLSSILKKIHTPKILYCTLPILLMLLYGLMTGMSASCARAIIMFIFRMLAGLFHRTYDQATALCLSAVMVLISNPKYLFYTGFQLSFGALLSVIIVLPIMKEILPKGLAAGISINVITLPIYLSNYFYFPFASILLNLYVIPLMSVLLGSSLVVLTISLGSLNLGKLLANIPHLILFIYESSCKFADLLPINKLVTGKPGTLQIFLYFLIVTATIMLSHKQTKLQIILNLCLAGIILTTNPSFGTKVTLIDVGQGDGIYISSNGKNILIDGGSSSVNKVGTYRISPFLLSQGTATLDAIFITHFDSDHYNGILELIEASGDTSPNIEHIYVSTASADYEKEKLSELNLLAASHNIPISSIKQGDAFRLGSTTSLSCLYPASQNHALSSFDSNSQSMTLLLTSYNTNLLLTGDLEGAGEQEVCDLIAAVKDNSASYASVAQAKNPSFSQINILKVAHHGSNNSTSDRFLEVFDPDLALISVGKNNSYGHPGKDTLARLDNKKTPWFCTKDQGALTLYINKKGIKLDSYN